MKAIPIFLFAMALGAAPPLLAQNAASIQTNATVIQSISVEARQELLLGDIVAGETKRVNVDGSAIGAEIGGEQAGVFRIESGGRVFVRFDNLPTSLLGVDPLNTGQSLPVRFLTSWSNSASGAGSASAIDPTSATAIETSGNDLYLFIGAEVIAPAAQREGLYTTTITILVTYGLE
jgi:hypothetical protein